MDFDIEKEYSKIYRYCYFKLHKDDIAEDITQETFLKFFSQSSYISRGKPMAYLYTIAKNLCNDYYNKKENLPLDEKLTYLMPDDDERMIVNNAIKQLTIEHQELLLLRYFNGLHIVEISELTKQSRFVVSRKINKALKVLKEKLDFDKE